jgi:purine-cytosine permease-like protein
MGLGVLLVIGGVLGFLPILGFWMIPLGIVVLSVDLHFIRRWRRKLEIWWGRRRQRKQSVSRKSGDFQ